MTWGESLTTEFGLWVDTQFSKDSTLHERGRTVEKEILLQTRKAAKISDVNLRCYVFNIQGDVNNLTTNNTINILQIEEEYR